MLGQEVKVLVNEFQKPDSYKVTFDATGLASGVYYYRLVTDNYAETRSMIVLK